MKKSKLKVLRLLFLGAFSSSLLHAEVKGSTYLKSELAFSRPSLKVDNALDSTNYLGFFGLIKYSRPHYLYLSGSYDFAWGKTNLGGDGLSNIKDSLDSKLAILALDGGYQFAFFNDSLTFTPTLGVGMNYLASEWRGERLRSDYDLTSYGYSLTGKFTYLLAAPLVVGLDLGLISPASTVQTIELIPLFSSSSTIVKTDYKNTPYFQLNVPLAFSINEKWGIILGYSLIERTLQVENFSVGGVDVTLGSSILETKNSNLHQSIIHLGIFTSGFGE